MATSYDYTIRMVPSSDWYPPGVASRVETREKNRVKLLVAARAEFAEQGYRDAKIDAVAARAGLTRGAVYSNFPGKRALYFAVLAEDAVFDGGPATATTPEAALGALARAWVSRLPLSTEPADLAADLLPEIAADERTRRPHAQLVALAAGRYGHALGALAGGRPRVRQAEAALTVLEGARQLASAAPGLVEPFHVVRTCESLPDLDSGSGDPALPPPAHEVDAEWAPPAAVDIITGSAVDLRSDGLVAVLGVNRLSGVVPALGSGPVTLVVVASAPAEVFGLVRLSIAETTSYLRSAFPAHTWPRLRVVLDETGSAGQAAGLAGVGDMTELALRVAGGRVRVRCEGLAACTGIAAHQLR
jgi:AcrR family transcriptional regulator